MSCGLFDLSVTVNKMCTGKSTSKPFREMHGDIYNGIRIKRASAFQSQWQKQGEER